jgi:hypothetical protein
MILRSTEYNPVQYIYTCSMYDVYVELIVGDLRMMNVNVGDLRLYTGALVNTILHRPQGSSTVEKVTVSVSHTTYVAYYYVASGH